MNLVFHISEEGSEIGPKYEYLSLSLSYNGFSRCVLFSHYVLYKLYSRWNIFPTVQFSIKCISFKWKHKLGKMRSHEAHACGKSFARSWSMNRIIIQLELSCIIQSTKVNSQKTEMDKPANTREKCCTLKPAYHNTLRWLQANSNHWFPTFNTNKLKIPGALTILVPRPYWVVTRCNFSCNLQ